MNSLSRDSRLSHSGNSETFFGRINLPGWEEKAGKPGPQSDKCSLRGRLDVAGTLCRAVCLWTRLTGAGVRVGEPPHELCSQKR